MGIGGDYTTGESCCTAEKVTGLFFLYIRPEGSESEPYSLVLCLGSIDAVVFIPEPERSRAEVAPLDLDDLLLMGSAPIPDVLLVPSLDCWQYNE